MMKKSFGVVSVFAECQDCDWRTENHKNGQANAARHARKTGHTVRVETVMVGHYYGSGSEKK